MSDDQLTLGLLLDEPAMERWAVDAVERAIRDTGVSVELVVLPTSDEPDARPPFRRYASSAVDNGAWSPVLGWHRLVKTPEYFKKVPIDELEWLDSADILRTKPRPAEDFGQRLSQRALRTIESVGVDALFRRGFGILKGEVLTTPRYGVLSYHHGDVREYRGVPPGVWEFANNEQHAGITLQRLTSTLDGGEIVVEKQVEIGELRTWQAVERELFEQSTDMLAAAFDNLGDSDFEPTVANELGPLYTSPGAIDTARIELKNARGRVANWLDRAH